MEIKYSNSECIICGMKYRRCNNCVKLNSFEEYEQFNMNEYCDKHNITGEEKHKMFLGFRSTCCEFTHYLVFGIIRNIKQGATTPQQAKLELSQLGFGIEEIKTFKASVCDFLLNYIADVDQSEYEATVVDVEIQPEEATVQEIVESEIQPEEPVKPEYPFQKYQSKRRR